MNHPMSSSARWLRVIAASLVALSMLAVIYLGMSTMRPIEAPISAVAPPSIGMADSGPAIASDAHQAAARAAVEANERYLARLLALNTLDVGAADQTSQSMAAKASPYELSGEALREYLKWHPEWEHHLTAPYTFPPQRAGGLLPERPAGQQSGPY